MVLKINMNIKSINIKTRGFLFLFFFYKLMNTFIIDKTWQ